MTDGTADWFWPAAERLNIPVMLNAPTLQAEIGKIAERHPRLRLIMDHMGRLKGTKDDELAPAIEATPLSPNIRTSSSSSPWCRHARRPPTRIATFTAMSGA